MYRRYVTKIALSACLALFTTASYSNTEIMGDSTSTGVAYISGNTFTNKEVTYDIVDGYGVFEGDIVLGTVAELQQSTSGVVAAGNTTGNVANGVIISGSNNRWKNGFIPYQFASGLPASTVQEIKDAMAHWVSKTSIRFVQRNATNQSRYPDYVVFRVGSGCASNVGRIGGSQSIWLAAGCSTGNTIHEIGHTVGYWHEQSRQDRNSFVNIIWANIQPGREHNFNQHITDGDDIGSYDYGSIMHYPRFAFSVNGQATIVPFNPPSASIGQRSGLSTGDIQTARTIARWMRISGALKQVSVGFGNQVWGVNANDYIYRYNGNNSWTRIAGRLKHVSVGQNGVVWGVNANDYIYRYNANNTWTRIPGRLKQLEVGAGGRVWGVNSSDYIYRYNGNNTWTNIPGRLKYVSVGQNGVVWGVNSTDYIYRYNGNSSWTKIPGRLKQIEVGSGGEVWGVNSGDYIYRYDNDRTWTRAQGRLQHVSVGKNGVVWGVNSGNAIYKLK